MKIGYDGKRAANNLTGLGNYSRSLIEHLAVQFPQNQYFVYTSKIKAQIKSFALFLLDNVLLKFPAQGQSQFLWRSMGVKKQLLEDKIDLYHGLSHEIPYGINKLGIKSIVTIHDLIFLKRPADFKLIDRSIYKLKSLKACQKADKIIAISEQTKKDIVALYGINPNKIEVLYQSCDDGFKISATPQKKQEVKNTYQLPDKYLLNVGTIEPRKNLLLIIKALAKTHANIPLVVIGKAKPYYNLVADEIVKQQLQDRVIFLKDVPFADLPTIYQLASLFVYPSFYEGFGIPIIEALYSGVPVIGATGSCLEEAGGPNSLYVDATDADELANKIDLVLEDSTIRQQMITAGLNYVQKFNSNVVTQQLMDCYKKTMVI
jgi:glycosyltransferase involved in cell wall biosynthesis